MGDDNKVPSDKQLRLQRLKELKLKVKKDNQQDLRNESLHRKLKSDDIRQKLKQDLGETIDPPPSAEVDKRHKLMHYSIDDTDKWHASHASSAVVPGNDDNVKKYHDEMNKLIIDKDDYHAKKHDDDLIHNVRPSSDKLQYLQSSMKLHRQGPVRKRGDGGVYINQENKKFNENLNQQYKQ